MTKMGVIYVGRTFAQEYIPHSQKILRRKRLDEERGEPSINVSDGRRPEAKTLPAHQGRQTRIGGMPISTNSFLAVVESTDSTALANKEASISSCTEFDEKYGRRCVSINEMNIQNASSSGDCNSSCPAINTNPTQKAKTQFDNSHL